MRLFKNKRLTNSSMTVILNSLSPHVIVGIGISKQTAQTAINAVFLCAKSQFFIMSGWAGIRKGGRVVCPVCQPVQSGSMIGIMLSGLKPNKRIPS
jgi:hypothetical protein